MNNPATITAAKRDYLLADPHASTRWGAVILAVSQADDGDQRLFVITGPSGRHTLLVAATNAARLDAHWKCFCSSPCNAPAPAPRSILRDYVVTLRWQDGTEEEIVLSALNHAGALRRGRDWKRQEYGRTRSCNLMPCSFRARLQNSN